MTLSVCIATWNSMKFIHDCLESVLRQKKNISREQQIDLAVNIVDNGSVDGTVEYIRKNYPQVRILKNINNLGFCRSYNQAIKMHNSNWVLILNVDTILEQDFLIKMFSVALRSNQQVAAFGPKVLKSETVIEDGLPKILKSTKIDSLGLGVKKSRQVINIGEGEEDIGQYDNCQEFFGFSGACVLFRREALESIKIGEEYFDEDFFAYQDDFDLFYRLRLYGWQNRFVPGAKVYHFRSAKINLLKPWQFWRIIKARRAKSLLTNYHSYKNHLFVLLKNEIPDNFFRNLPQIFWFELKKFVYILFLETKTALSLRDFFKNFSKMRFKRKIIMARRKASTEEIRKWFS